MDTFQRTQPAAFVRGGATAKNMRWLDNVADDPGLKKSHAVFVGFQLIHFNDDKIFPSAQFIADAIKLNERVVVATLWGLYERGHIDLKVDGSKLSCRRLTRSDGRRA